MDWVSAGAGALGWCFGSVLWAGALSKCEGSNPEPFLHARLSWEEALTWEPDACNKFVADFLKEGLSFQRQVASEETFY